MTGGVNNNYNSSMRAADVGGRRLLGVNGLTHWVNTGNTLPDTYNGKPVKDKSGSIGGFLTLTASLVAAGIGVYYLCKTGKIDKIKDALSDFGDNASAKWTKFKADFKQQWDDEIGTLKKRVSEVNEEGKTKRSERAEARRIKRESKIEARNKKAEARDLKRAEKEAARNKKAEARELRHKAKEEARNKKAEARDLKRAEKENARKQKKQNKVSIFTRIANWFKRKNKPEVVKPENKVSQATQEIQDEAARRIAEAKNIERMRAAQDEVIKVMQNPSGMSSKNWEESLLSASEVAEIENARLKEIQDEAARRIAEKKHIENMRFANDAKLARMQNPSGMSSKNWEESLLSASEVADIEKAKKNNLINRLLDLLQSKAQKDEAQAAAQIKLANKIKKEKAQQEAQRVAAELSQKAEKRAIDVNNFVLDVNLSKKSAEESADIIGKALDKAESEASKWSLDESFFEIPKLKAQVEELIAYSPKKAIVSSTTHPSEVYDILIDNKTGKILSEMLKNENCIGDNCVAYGGVSPEFILKILGMKPDDLKTNKLYRIRFSSNPEFAFGMGANPEDFVKEPLLKFSRKPSGFIECKNHVDDNLFVSLQDNNFGKITRSTKANETVSVDKQKPAKKEGFLTRTFNKIFRRNK